MHGSITVNSNPARHQKQIEQRPCGRILRHDRRGVVLYYLIIECLLAMHLKSRQAAKHIARLDRHLSIAIGTNGSHRNFLNVSDRVSVQDLHSQNCLSLKQIDRQSHSRQIHIARIMHVSVKINVAAAERNRFRVGIFGQMAQARCVRKAIAYQCAPRTLQNLQNRLIRQFSVSIGIARRSVSVRLSYINIRRQRHLFSCGLLNPSPLFDSVRIFFWICAREKQPKTRENERKREIAYR